MEALIQCILSYQESDVVLEAVFNFQKAFSNIPVASLALEILGQILESGFVNENYRNRNLYREKITGDELFKLKDICELLVADYK